MMLLQVVLQVERRRSEPMFSPFEKVSCLDNDLQSAFLDAADSIRAFFHRQ